MNQETVRVDPSWESAVVDSQTFRPLVIGDIRIDFPVIQAALSGYSDGPMRIVARRLGAPYTVAEVRIDRFLLDLKNRDRTRHYLQIADEEHPVGGQLMGSEPSQFGPAALKLVAAGFDVIDINFGCPVKTAMGGCRGGFHLGQPAVALEIISRTRDVVPPHVPVTVKMRRGIDDTEQSRDRFYEILDGAFSRGVAAATVHARTVAQKYVGSSDWSFLAEVQRHVGSKTIIGSGDLFRAEDCLRMLRETGVSGCSVARGAIGNPWIFQQVRSLAAGQRVVLPVIAEQRRVLEMHATLSIDYSGREQALPTMRMFAIKFAALHPEPIAVRNAFATIRTWDAWSDVLTRFYCNHELKDI